MAITIGGPPSFDVPLRGNFGVARHPTPLPPVLAGRFRCAVANKIANFWRDNLCPKLNDESPRKVRERERVARILNFRPPLASSRERASTFNGKLQFRQIHFEVFSDRVYPDYLGRRFGAKSSASEIDAISADRVNRRINGNRKTLMRETTLFLSWNMARDRLSP